MARFAMLKGAQPFEFPGNEVGAVLLHGWSATPSQVREMGEILRERLGVSVICPLYAGHGTSPEDMAETTWRDWDRTAVDAYYSLQSSCKKVYVLGLSMGGLLALHLAAHYNVAGVISINAPIYLRNPKARLAPLLKRVRKWEIVGEPVPGVGKYPNTGYGRIPVRAVAELLKAIAHIRRDLAMIKAPCLILQTTDDESVNPRSAQTILESVGSADKRTVWIAGGGHVVTVSKRRDQVFGLVSEFVSRGGTEFDNDDYSKC